MSHADAAASDGGLLRSSSVMAVGTALSRVLGFVRSAVLAAAIGIGVTADTFGVANTIPNILYILLAGGVLNAVFVPQVVRAMQQPDGGRAYTDRLLTLAGAVLAVVTLVATLAAPLVVRVYAGGKWTAEDMAVATAFTFWCLPQIFFYGLYTLIGQVLNARGSFGPMMWAPIVNNLVAIAGGLLFLALFSVDFLDPSTLGPGAIALLGGSATLGVVLQALVLLPVLRRTGFGWSPRWDFRGQGLGKAGDLAKWTLLFVLVNQLAYVVIVRLATNAGKAAAVVAGQGAGGYVTYSNAYLIFILPHSVLTVSIVTGLLPRMSRAAADGRLGDLREDLSTGWRLCAVGTVLVAAGYLALGPDLTRVLFAANVSTEDARFVGLVTAAFALGLPAFSAQYVALRAFYALEDTRTPFFLQAAIAATNVALALAAYAVAPLRWKVVALALAYSATYAVGLALSTAVLRRRLGGVDGPRVVRAYVRLVAAVALPALAAWGVARLVADRVGVDLVASLTALAAGGLVLVGGFLAGARLLRIPEVAALTSTVRGRLGR
ncbi:MAG: putative peptidoglycan lipid flippase [Actinomycetota bacterium]|nr:putative peptidoglycan lipid flippase [Actinomycetota bacterium]